jgi:phage shock protein E
MKYILPFLLLIAIASCQEPKANSQTAAPEIKIVRDTFWIDVRTPGEFEAGHLPEASNIPLQVFPEQFPKLIPQKDKVVALYCRSGNRSGQALKMALEMGYTKAYNAGAFSTLSETRK